jgi:Mg2+ and Co2+ transporter CorA
MFIDEIPHHHHPDNLDLPHMELEDDTDDNEEDDEAENLHDNPSDDDTDDNIPEILDNLVFPVPAEPPLQVFKEEDTSVLDQLWGPPSPLLINDKVIPPSTLGPEEQLLNSETPVDARDALYNLDELLSAIYPGGMTAEQVIKALDEASSSLQQEKKAELSDELKDIIKKLKDIQQCVTKLSNLVSTMFKQKFLSNKDIEKDF